MAEEQTASRLSYHAEALEERVPLWRRQIRESSVEDTPIQVLHLPFTWDAPVLAEVV